MTRLRRILRGAALLLGSGYVLFFFSERVFWSLWRPGDAWPAMLGGWLLYSFFGYLLLAAIRFFRVGDLWSLFLAGAFFGWLGEGVYAMTLFGYPGIPFPLTISWTALAWHAPITVVLGWYGLRRALQAPGIGPALAASCGFGLFWGIWAVAWALETPPILATPGEFLAHAAAATALLALAQGAITAGRPQGFDPSRWGVVPAVALVLAFLGLVTTPAIPIAPLVLLPLALLLAWAGRRNRARARGEAGGGDLLDRMGAPVRRRNLPALAAMPLVATGTYSGLNAAGLVWPTNLVIAGITTLAGFVLLAMALWKVLRRGAAPLLAPALEEGG
ncbi:hypothetical protein LPC08_03680 [Roseomonas sp. OT10]|uniref:hypothetical protein n=1 Tax=Roseomonas cutis TaxID=2897332 RepID=UPI001E42AD91|nr:hypothetical protein [Roseomonas sp. OT10]UFN49757.1 hypothetical protein LPC08_03680 [Roseomonas sp. OT10]